VPGFLLTKWLDNWRQSRAAEVKGTEPGFFLRDWLENWRGRQNS
jgi:hypothetical protein